MTIEDAKKYLRENFDDGCVCPACGQVVRRYRRRITSNVAGFLMELVRAYERDARYYHYSEINFTGRDYPFLAYWDLVEEKVNEDTGKRCSGYWRPTGRGIAFARGRIAVHKYALVYDGRVTGYDGESVTVIECLRDPFSYEELRPIIRRRGHTPTLF